MNAEDLQALCDALRPPALKQLVAQLRYMGKQYGAGQAARGGTKEPHYLERAADELDALFAKSVSCGQEIADLRNVVQVACAEGVPAMAKAWEKYFPDHPITVRPAVMEAAPAVPAAGVDSLHAAIMNLPCNSPYPAGTGGDNCYRVGHRDARHAAAELVSAALSAAPGSDGVETGEGRQG